MTTSPPADASNPFVASHAALLMLEVFASVGGTLFDVTFTNAQGEKRGFRRAQTLNQLTASIPYLLRSNVTRRINVIVRPQVQLATCIQLDDLDAAKAARIAPAAFLTLQTSPGNYQSWVAVDDAPRGLTARLRRGIGADLNASGATRVAGTVNFKTKYAPHFPTVRIQDHQLGHIATVAELEALHVLAPAPRRVEPLPAVSNARPARMWPSYQKCLAGAPEGPSGHPSRTKADFVWCKIALSWNHSVEATVRELMRVSTKAQENGESYARKTAESATDAAAQYKAKKLPRPTL